MAPSMKTATVSDTAIWTISGSAALGRMCRTSTRGPELPPTRAAVT
ncbi:hypothetical protein GA0115255_123991 [Streptomyces sp. Ncost-T6T-2b]|nr:hypothetical protein GA0115255_123991 [Streptomyces sp. Ncost-T6T-2b]